LFLHISNFKFEKEGSMATTVAWQVRVGSMWIPLDAATSAALETAFTTSSTVVSQVSGNMGASGPPISQDVDMAAMTWAHAPIRRTKSVTHAARSMNLEFWDGQVWIEYDDYLHALVIDAIAAGRKEVGVHIGDHHVVVHFPNGASGDMFQVSSNQVQRPVRAKGAAIHIASSPLTVPVVDDEALPDDLRCPITQCPLHDPVTAADGHVYERKAIERWISSQSVPKSPVTNVALASNVLYPAHFVRKVLQSYASADAAAPADAAASASAGKRKAAPSTTAKKMRRPQKRTTLCSNCTVELDPSSVIVPCRICRTSVICAECDTEEVFVCNGCQGV
jgi:hypothetical protein